jgi:hypothetical protein
MRHMHWRLQIVLAGALAASAWAGPAASGDTTNGDETRLGSPMGPSVRVVRQGDVLVLTYNPLGSNGEPLPNAGSPGRSPALAVYQGQRKIASAQFEHG